MTPPNQDEIEVTVFGPSYGESIVIHLGDSCWIIVDSCVRKGSLEPVSIQYLRQIGVAVDSDVKLIVVTHWHDDHISGISNTVQACNKAAICVPSSFNSDTFQSFLAAHTDATASVHGTGVDEILGVFQQMRTSIGKNHLATEDKRILSIPLGTLSHGNAAEVWTLSPSSFQAMESLGTLATLIPGFGETKRRAVPTERNDHSIALWISVGEDNILLGGDLEETNDPRAGWKAVVLSANRPQGTAALFKIPHHGSETGHNADVWEKMLAPSPHAVLTPWNRSSKLPKQSDLDRLSSLTPNVHLTAPPRALNKVKHPYEVEKILRDFGIVTFEDPPAVGVITARKARGASDWTVKRQDLPT